MWLKLHQAACWSPPWHRGGAPRAPRAVSCLRLRGRAARSMQHQCTLLGMQWQSPCCAHCATARALLPGCAGARQARVAIGHPPEAGVPELKLKHRHGNPVCISVIFTIARMCRQLVNISCHSQPGSLFSELKLMRHMNTLHQAKTRFHSPVARVFCHTLVLFRTHRNHPCWHCETARMCSLATASGNGALEVAV